MSPSNQSPKRRVSLAQGFTLVELLVVLTLMGLVLALVGPLSIDSFERMKSRDELLELKHMLRLASADAFLSSTWLTVIMNGGDLTIQNGAGPLRDRSFKYLSFPSQEIRFSPQGLPLGEPVQLLRRGKEELIEFEPLLRPRRQGAENGNSE